MCSRRKQNRNNWNSQPAMALLLKAREDLRLDERIMQFLRIMNYFLAANQGKMMAAKHYHVIPLSESAGLIQMVPNVVSFFQIYSNWQQKASPKQSDSSEIPSPTTAFYALLKQQGLSENASERPHAVLKSNYQQLSAQLRRDILKYELLSHANDFSDVRKQQNALTRPLAVMSVLGYVVGVGDRHLDNILYVSKAEK